MTTLFVILKYIQIINEENDFFCINRTSNGRNFKAECWKNTGNIAKQQKCFAALSFIFSAVRSLIWYLTTKGTTCKENKCSHNNLVGLVMRDIRYWYYYVYKQFYKLTSMLLSKDLWVCVQLCVRTPDPSLSFRLRVLPVNKVIRLIAVISKNCSTSATTYNASFCCIHDSSRRH